MTVQNTWIDIIAAASQIQFKQDFCRVTSGDIRKKKGLGLGSYRSKEQDIKVLQMRKSFTEARG